MSRERILVVDDEPDICRLVQEILEDEGYVVETAPDAAGARERAAARHPDLVLLDIWMPDTDGITLLKEWSSAEEDLLVVMMSGHGSVETAVEAIRFGAYDFVEKPLSTAKLLVTVEHALVADRLRRENQRLRLHLEPASRLVGRSAAMEELRENIRRIAATDSWVLVTGEPGSGKGVVARYLHSESARANGQFVDVSLAAIPSQNIGVQLFGSEDGGTIREGRFEQAGGGTLFLDEIADMDLDTQAKLLSALEEQRFMRVGGSQYVDLDVRIIAATNQDLDQAVRENRFREDLYYRLNVVPVHVPPLRDHREDVPDLVNFYLDFMVERERLPYRKFSTGALNLLRNHTWPGNVRELKNLLQRLLILNRGEEVTREEVDLAIGARHQDGESGEMTESLFELPLREAR
ncbi:MAG: sigma-54 dependent transcriptional regulator, partial [Gammaproteobacteria bacterium]|nr:sigma-54 dependent transcriptional regulator [Gammaproteobacteria bacterium]